MIGANRVGSLPSIIGVIQQREDEDVLGETQANIDRILVVGDIVVVVGGRTIR